MFCIRTSVSMSMSMSVSVGGGWRRFCLRRAASRRRHSAVYRAGGMSSAGVRMFGSKFWYLRRVRLLLVAVLRS